MLDNLPHDQMFSQIIISQLAAYYDRCYGWYKGKFPDSMNCLSR